MKSDNRRSHKFTHRFLAEVSALVLLLAAPALAQRALEGGQPFPLESVAADLIVDDFNADGRLDVAAAGGGAVSVFLGDPETLLAAPRSYDVAARVLRSGDFDADGFPDLMAARSALFTTLVTVLLNQTDGSFRPGEGISIGVAGPDHAELVDLDEDGALDAIVGDERRVHLLFGDGRGSFQGRPFPGGRNDLRGLAVNDFDADGHDDLVTASTGRIDWHRGRGDGEFEDPVTTVLSLSAPPRFLTSGDLLQDGLPDLAVAGKDGAIFVLANAGGGFFFEQFVGELPGFGSRIFGRGFFRAVDYDGDGLLDIITPLGGTRSAVLRVLLGVGDGTFALELDVAMGVGLMLVELGDLDGDASLDAVVARSDLPEIVVFRGQGPAALETPVSVPLEVGPRDLVIADVNLDGSGDLVLMSSSTLVVVEADGAGGFESPVLTRFDDRGFQSIIGADFGPGGDSEVALTDQVRNEIAIVFFESGTVVETVAHPVGELPIGLTAGDFDRDGATDLAVVYRHHPELSVLLEPGIKGREPREIQIPLGAGQSAVATGDVDGDGAADLAVTTRRGLTILYGDGAGAFPRLVSLDLLANAPSLALADVDEDGALDLVAAARRRIIVVRRVGVEDRPAAEEIDLGVELRALEVVDLADDGRLEAVTATSNAIAVTPLVAAGGFGFTEYFTVGVTPRAIAVGDLDGDGRLDVASADFASRSLTVLRGADTTQVKSFRRGDADGSGQVNLSDAVVILGRLFEGAGPLACPDAADADDDGRLTVTDPVRVLTFLFGGAAPPPVPGPAACGPDPTADALGACSVECPL